MDKASSHARALVEMAETDAGEIRRGLPEGARELAKIWSAEDLSADPQAARDALERARDKVQDLRVAKSTFFALTDATGLAIRNDREQDLMAGHNLVAAFPSLKPALEGGYAEALGPYSGRLDKCSTHSDRMVT